MAYGLTIFIYLSALIVVGVVVSRFVKSTEDFMVAGRGLSAKVLVGTLLATWIGSGSIIGGAGLAYDKGFAALWFDLGVWIAIVVLYIIAPRARRFAQFTVPDILEARYNPTARALGTLVTIVAYTAIVSYQFRAGGMVLELVAGIPPFWGIIITALFVIAYTALAGMFSVAYTDVVNGVVMTVGLIVALPFLLGAAGGWEGVTAQLGPEKFAPLGGMTLLEAAAYTLPTLLLLLGESNMYQRFFSAKDPPTARRAVVGWIGGTIVIETLIVVIAIIGSAVYLGIDGEMVILHSVRHGLPVAIGCVLLAAIVAVIVSTADSFLLVPSTNLFHDVYLRFIAPDTPETRALWLTRGAAVLLGAFAYAQVQLFPGVLEMAIYAYTMYGVGITPAVLAAFFWRRATPAGGVSSIAAGMVVTVVWELLTRYEVTSLPTVYPALVASLGCLVIVSLMTAKPEPEKWRGLAGGVGKDETRLTDIAGTKGLGSTGTDGG